MLCIWNTSMLFIINIRKIDHKETIFLHNCSRCKVRPKTRVLMLITKKSQNNTLMVFSITRVALYTMAFWSGTLIAISLFFYLY